MSDARDQDSEPGAGQEIADRCQGERGAATGPAQGEEADRSGRPSPDLPQKLPPTRRQRDQGCECISLSAFLTGIFAK
jgi:hypothetical protein